MGATTSDEYHKHIEEDKKFGLSFPVCYGAGA
jgi:ATP-dependent Clp protease ATP-binding subunit ClpA